MTMLTWLIVGGVCGLLAAFILRGREERKVRRNMFVGIVGAVVAGILLAPMFEIEIVTQRVFSFPVMLVGLAGAIALLAAFHLYKRFSNKPA